MSLTTSLITLSKYIGIPSDISNLIVQYSIDEDNPWLLQYNSVGDIYRKVNPEFFFEVSCVLAMKHVSNSSLSHHPLVVNEMFRYDMAETYVQRSYKNDDGDLEYVLYTTNEVSPGRFEYFSIMYRITPYSHPLREFVRGTLYRPSEEISWNREQTITDLEIIHSTMYVSHTEVQIDYVWNTNSEQDYYIETADFL